MRDRFFYIFMFGTFLLIATVKQNLAQDNLPQTFYTADKLIEIALQNRADLQAERQKLAIAEANLQLSSLRPNPTLEGEYVNGALFGDADRDFRIGASQIFELGGKRQKRIAVARLEIEKTRLEIAQIEREIASAIRKSFVEVLAKTKQLEFVEKLLENDKEFLRLTDARISEGDVAPLDSNLLRVETDNLRVRIVQLKSDIDAKMFELKQISGLDINQDISFSPISDAPARFDLSLAQITSIALKNRADLQIAKQNQVIAASKINLANADRIPDITGSVAYQQRKQVFDFPNFVKKDNELAIGVSVELPFSRRYKSEAAIAQAEKSSAEFQAVFLTNKIKAETAVAFRRYKASAEILVLYSTQILPRSDENLKSIRAAYNLGEFSLLEVVTEQRKLTENLEKYNDALRNYYDALTDIENAVGTSIALYLLKESSVLPDKNLVLGFDKDKFLKKENTQIVK